MLYTTRWGWYIGRCGSSGYQCVAAGSIYGVGQFVVA
jgi:hypothetical protein